MCVRLLLGRILAVIIYLYFIFLFCLFKQTSSNIFDSIIKKHYFTHVVMFVCFGMHAWRCNQCDLLNKQKMPISWSYFDFSLYMVC
jgi:hypothetical protein